MTETKTIDVATEYDKVLAQNAEARRVEGLEVQIEQIGRDLANRTCDDLATLQSALDVNPYPDRRADVLAVWARAIARERLSPSLDTKESVSPQMRAYYDTATEIEIGIEADRILEQLKKTEERTLPIVDGLKTTMKLIPPDKIKAKIPDIEAIEAELLAVRQPEDQQAYIWARDTAGKFQTRNIRDIQAALRSYPGDKEAALKEYFGRIAFMRLPIPDAAFSLPSEELAETGNNPRRAFRENYTIALKREIVDVGIYFRETMNAFKDLQQDKQLPEKIAA